jgi:probable F420-dependent oxidoreductase
VKFDVTALSASPASAADDLAAAEARGCDAWLVPETAHDPFVVAGMASARRDEAEIGTGVAVAFARNPMDVAYSANDLQELCGGRFLLGLGSQVQAHIERRFSMPWSHPAARMREFIAALRAIWAAWHDDVRLEFRGDFYEHRLMTPFFAGTAHGFGAPRVGLAAVGPKMTEVAGEVADLLFCNPLTTPEYLRHTTLPALRRGAERAGRDPSDLDVSVGVFVVTGRDPAERAAVAAATRAQLAFYASTPPYRPVLEVHGWVGIQSELSALARDGRWAEMAGLIDDSMLDALAVVVDDPADAGPAIAKRFGGLATRAYLYGTWQPDEAQHRAVRETLR